MAEEYPCPHCGRGAFTIRDNSDAPIPIRVPDSVHDDEGRPVGCCPWCDEEISAEGLRTSDLQPAVRELMRIWDSDEPDDWRPGVLSAAMERVRNAALIARPLPPGDAVPSPPC